MKFCNYLVVILFFSVHLNAQVNFEPFGRSFTPNWIKDMSIPAGNQQVAAPQFQGCQWDDQIINLPLIQMLVPVSETEQLQLGFASGETADLSHQAVFRPDYKPLKIQNWYPEAPVVLGNRVTIRKKDYIELKIYGAQVNSSGKMRKFTQMQYQILKTTYQKSNKTKKTYADHSVLASGTWKKIGYTQGGIARLSYSQLQNWGLPLQSIDPKTFKIYGNGSKMLSQKAGDPRYDDLFENAIEVVGESDGSFDSQDYLQFYIEAPHQVYADTNKNLFHETNLYSDTNYVFLTWGGANGKRIQNMPNSSGAISGQIDTTRNLQFREDEVHNLIETGRMWFGEKLDFTTSQSFTFDLPNLKPNSPVKITARVVGRSNYASSFQITESGNLIGNIPIDVINVNCGVACKYASIKSGTFYMNSNALTDGQANLTLNYVKSGAGEGWIDYVTVEYTQNLKMNGEVYSFMVRDSGSKQLRLETSNNNLNIWNIDQAQVPQKLVTQSNAGFLTQDLELTGMHKFIAFSGNQTVGPISVAEVANQDLHGVETPDYIMICGNAFVNEAERLANMHRTVYGRKVLVLTQEVIYNEFGGGKVDISAIRDFLKMFYDRSTAETAPKHLLMFGDGSYDYKALQSEKSEVITYQSRESFYPPYSYTSDDFFTFLDDNEGFWGEATNIFPGDVTYETHYMDIAVGRLPAHSQEDAKTLVDKMINYVTNPESQGAWRQEILFIADMKTGSFPECNHMDEADQLSNQVLAAYPCMKLDKVYLDSYPAQNTAEGVRWPQAKTSMINRMNQGSLIINYTGHGGETGWSNARIFEIPDIQSLSNQNRLPFYITATCEFGRWDEPELKSGAEYLMTNPNGGSLGLLTSTRVAFSNANFGFNQAFYNNVFTFNSTENRFRTLGETLIGTKTAAANFLVGTRIFALLCDPGITLAFPDHQAVITHINTDTIGFEPDTIKARQLVSMSGQIQDFNGNLIPDFNGEVKVTVVDKPSGLRTYICGRQFNIQKNNLFNGPVTVTNGKFNFQFRVPLDIAYSVGFGQISMYATSTQQDASGCFKNLVICCTDTTAPADSLGPEVQAYLNDDCCWIDGGLVNENPKLIVHVSDPSGINTTGLGIGRELVAVIDGNTNAPIVLNQYFTAAKDSFQAGTIEYPLTGLSAGAHTMSIKVWDTNNNSGTDDIHFVVKSSEKLALDHVYNYPNPFTTKTTFMFEHNQTGNNLDVQVNVFTITGKKVKSLARKIYAESKICNEIEWDGKDDFGDKLARGAYIYQVEVKVESTGEHLKKIEKLVILK